MPQKKIKDEDELTRSVKKAHQQMQAVSRKMKEAKKEIALLRREFDEKVPDNTSDADRKLYEQFAGHMRRMIDSDFKRKFREAEMSISDAHRNLNMLV